MLPLYFKSNKHTTADWKPLTLSFVLWGGWGERKRERAGHDGKGEERREASLFPLPLPIVPRALSIIVDYWYFDGDTQREPLRRREPPGNEEWTGSQPSVISAFRGRSWRTIAIFRGNSSNAFFLRSAALGKSCMLHIDYFIERAWLWHLIRSICWGMWKLTSCAHSYQFVLKLVLLFVINFRIPGHLLESLWMTSMLFVIPRPGLKCK